VRRGGPEAKPANGGRAAAAHAGIGAGENKERPAGRECPCAAGKVCAGAAPVPPRSDSAAFCDPPDRRLPDGAFRLFAGSLFMAEAAAETSAAAPAEQDDH